MGTQSRVAARAGSTRRQAAPNHGPGRAQFGRRFGMLCAGLVLSGAFGIIAAADPPATVPPVVITIAPTAPREVAPAPPNELAQPPPDGSGTGDGSGGTDGTGTQGEPGGVAGVPGIPCGTLKTPLCQDPPTSEPPTTKPPEDTTERPTTTKPEPTTPEPTTPPTITLPPITIPPITLPPTTAPEPTTPPTSSTEDPTPTQDLPPPVVVPPPITTFAPPRSTTPSPNSVVPPVLPPPTTAQIPLIPVPSKLELSPAAISPGDKVTASGSGCMPLSPVTLTIGGTRVGSATAGADSTFRAPLTLSAVDVGRYEVVAQCGRTLSASLDIVLISRINSATSTLTIIIFFLLLGGWFYGHRLASHAPVRRPL